MSGRHALAGCLGQAWAAVWGLIHSFLCSQRILLYSSHSLTPASLGMPTDSCVECSRSSPARCQLDVPGCRAGDVRAELQATLPPAGSPAANTWTGSLRAGQLSQLSQLWFLLCLRVWLLGRGKRARCCGLCRWGHGLPLEPELWVQGCKPKSIIQTGAEGVVSWRKGEGAGNTVFTRTGPAG